MLIAVKDGDPRLVGLHRRHYSARRNQLIRQAIGPGRKFALMTLEQNAVIAFRAHRDGTDCCLFRNEGPRLSSCIIAQGTWRAAEYLDRWLIRTFVDPEKVRSPNPGYCFKVAGYTFAGLTKGGLHMLEWTPETATDPVCGHCADGIYST